MNILKKVRLAITNWAISVICDKQFVIIMISSFLWGIMAHGTILFNKFSFHDDISAFNNIGMTFDMGRWALDRMGKVLTVVTGTTHYSLPIINGFITIFSIGGILYLIAKKCKIESPIMLVILDGMMIAFPAIIGIFAYMFTAPYYYLAALIGVIGAYVFYNHKNVITALICILLMAVCVGVYQANIPILVCTLLLFMLQEVTDDNISFGQYIKLAFVNIAICIGFMVAYFAINKFYLVTMHLKMASNEGVNNFGVTSVTDYLIRIVNAYHSFIDPKFTRASGNMYPHNQYYFYILLLLITLVLVIYYIYSVIKNDVVKGIESLLIIVIFPLASYLIHVMTDSGAVHTLMGYGEVFIIVLIVWIISKIGDDNELINWVKIGAVSVIAIITLMNTRLANISYLKMELLQSEAISYFTTLVTNIEAVDGYTTDMPVVYINEFDKKSDNFGGMDEFDSLTLIPYYYDVLLNNYSWEKMMRIWCGFNPVKGEAEDFKNLVEVNSMPCYPDDGSVRIIDNTVVVKFSDRDYIPWLQDPVK